MKKLFILLCLLINSGFTQEYRVIALDWEIAETMLALNIEPIGVGDKRSYAIWAQNPPLSENVLDLGSRTQPNLEQLILLKPDMILAPKIRFGINQHIISQYAHTVLIDFYTGENLWNSALKATQQMGQILHKEHEALNLIQQTQSLFETLKQELDIYNLPPIAVLQPIDSKQFRIYGKNSLFGVVLEKMGLSNAFQEDLITTNLWGITTIPITTLFDFPKNTQIVLIQPFFLDIDTQIKQNSLYQNLDFFQNTITLTPIWSSGGLLSMQRFAQELYKQLQKKLTNE